MFLSGNINNFKIISSFLKQAFPKTTFDKNIIKDLVINDLSNCEGAYIKFSKQFGILFINEKNYSAITIAHELIHFIQDVTGKAITLPYKIEDKFIAIESLPGITKLSKLTGDNLNTLRNIFNNEELVPYINNICHNFEILFKTDNVSPLKTINELIRYVNQLISNNGTYQDLLDHINSHNKLSKLPKIEKLILIVCTIFGQHRTLIKKIVGNYFKDL